MMRSWIGIHSYKKINSWEAYANDCPNAKLIKIQSILKDIFLFVDIPKPNDMPNYEGYVAIYLFNA